ncbi:hypothetical protein [Diaminobutyricimonas sp. LJ205]|uniref:hypothetical protein n=1 Tax=Diaminobutyricimonas sp. LJ205 TaxID=2683590 RepID=UPI0012F4F553|nr:hypothetical protein [Diaminobutyricimonas sp. LJ205]
MSSLRTKQEVLEQARQVFWAGVQQSRLLPPRERAIAAYYAGGPSVDDIERAILAEMDVESAVSPQEVRKRPDSDQHSQAQKPRNHAGNRPIQRQPITPD